MDLLLEISLSVAWAAVFLFLISRISFFKTSAIPVRWFQGVFVLKMLFGVVLWAIYTFYYTDRFTADIYKYFDDSKPMYDALKAHPVDYFKMLFGFQNDGEYFNQYYDQMNNWFREYDSNLYNDSHTIIRFNAAVRLLSFGYYNVHSVFMCFISLLGLTAIYKTFEPIVKDKSKLLFAAVFLLPSVLFWGSGVLKEGILFFGLGFLIYFFHRALDKQGSPIFSVLWIAFSVALIAFTKFYILGAIIPALIANLWLRFSNERKPVFKYTITMLVCLVIGLGAHHLLPVPNPLQLLSAKQKDFNLLVKGGVYLESIEGLKRDTFYIESQYYDQIEYDRSSQIAEISGVTECWSVKDSLITEKRLMVYADDITFHVIKDYGKTGSSIHTGELEPNVLSFVKALPRAFYNAFFRPWPLESLQPFTLFAGLENFAILLFILYAFIRGRWQSVNKKWLIFCLSFVLVVYLLTGFTTPVLGSIVRYRIPAMPFLVIAGLLLLQKESLQESPSN